jgi:ribonucleoside-diphosphate reductase alpha chain
MKSYSTEEALKESSEFFNGDTTASSVFVGKYALRNDLDEIVESTPDAMHRRLATEFANAESMYKDGMGFDEIYSLFKGFKYVIPQGSPMSAIGNPYAIQSASNCFVIPSPVDSYGGIFQADQQQAQIMKRRGGVGFDISNIRPKGQSTSNAAKTTDGIAVFMDRFSNTCREVAQGGRRGALMLTLSVHHPEIETFINIKRNQTRVTGANISIRVTDAFMRAVKANEKYTLQWPVDSNNPKIVKEVNARDIWNQIVKAAWESAEPGVLFWDNAKNMTPSDIYAEEGFGSTSTNPCGEIVLSPNDSCRLMALNLYSFVENKFTNESWFDYVKFAEVAYKAQHLMDSMIDIEIGQVDKIISKIENDAEDDQIKKIELDLWKNIRSAALKGRRTGLGITGLGDALAALGITYGAKESVEVTEKIYKSLAVNAYRATIDMAEVRGAFEVFNYEKEKNHPFLLKVISELGSEYVNKWKKFGRRNIALTTTAPTGSVSMMTQTTSGIEPAFSVKYTRRRKINPEDSNATVAYVDGVGDKFTEYNIFHHAYKEWMNVTGMTDADYEKSPYFKATANDVDWRASVDIQAAAQRWVCHSISKTCNLPSNVSEDLVAQVYMDAWEKGCKGFTVYRDGCRSGILITEKPKEEAKHTGFSEVDAPKRPTSLECEVHHVKISGQQWVIFVGLYEGRPYEVFGGIAENIQLPRKIKSGKIVKVGKKEGRGIYSFTFGEGEDAIVIKDIVKAFACADYAFHTLAVSGLLRTGMGVQYVLDIFNKADEEADLFSFNKVISRVLKHHIKDGTKAGEKCPNCGSEMIFTEGCKSCTCGYSKCG